MARKRTLLILAAGMGNRYGGLKQIDHFGPNGEAIIDYTMYDAIRAGFNKIVFLIREDFEKAFRKRFEPNLSGQDIEVAYGYQHIGKGSYTANSGRDKPWGTGEAVLSCRNVINEPFAVVNADDFYGYSSLKILSDFLWSLPDHSENQYGMIAYYLKATLSEYGEVSRGIIHTDGNDNLQDIHEYKKIRYNEEGKITGERALNGKKEVFSPDTLVSMNLWGFTQDIFSHLERLFAEFLEANAGSSSAEFYLPEAVSSLLEEGLISTRVFRTEESWFGVTYRKDKKIAIRQIHSMIETGMYPESLWE